MHKCLSKTVACYSKVEINQREMSTYSSSRNRNKKTDSYSWTSFMDTLAL